jgi:ketosteroid isomerase-like protein
MPLVTLLAALIVASVMPASAASLSPREPVWAAEVAFARSMAQRDLRRFSEFVSEEAIFFDGSTALTGKDKVVEGWASLFKDAAAPFSWAPDQVEVLAS